MVQGYDKKLFNLGLYVLIKWFFFSSFRSIRLAHFIKGENCEIFLSTYVQIVYNAHASRWLAVSEEGE